MEDDQPAERAPFHQPVSPLPAVTLPNEQYHPPVINDMDHGSSVATAASSTLTHYAAPTPHTYVPTGRRRIEENNDDALYETISLDTHSTQSTRNDDEDSDITGVVSNTTSSVQSLSSSAQSTTATSRPESALSTQQYSTTSDTSGATTGWEEGVELDWNSTAPPTTSQMQSWDEQWN